ncbi:MAG: lipid A-modifier LpxR family protein [Paracoccaceae bacterium]
MKSVIRAALVVTLIFTAAQQAQAQERDRRTVGIGRIFDNDFLGDFQDRWRTGSYTVSIVTAPGWHGKLPESFGAIREYRLRAEVIAPSNLKNPDPADRRYAGVLSAGLHTHFRRGPAEISVGGDLVAVGPQTGLGAFQTDIHDLLGQPSPKAATANQIGNAFHPTALAEFAFPVRMSGRIRARPFVEVQAGVETFLRVGGDFAFGAFGRDDLALRDVTTGQLYYGTHSGGPAVSFVVGGDVAKVVDSAYLPSKDGYDLTDTRARLRAGMNVQKKNFGIFYGLTWLGKEFKAQSDEQVVGSINIRLDF